MEKKKEKNNDDTQCFECLSTNLQTTVQDESFLYGIAPNEAQLHASIPVRTCPDCGMNYTDWEGEDARTTAVEKYLSEKKGSGS